MLPDFRNKIVLAPMEDVTEPPFRLVCKRLGADVVYTEFISSEGLIRDARKAREKLFFYDGNGSIPGIASSLRSSQIVGSIEGNIDSERPIGIQIFGGNEDVMKEAAQICESANPDFIDINCGCWVKDVALRGAGAGLLKDLPKMKRIAETVLHNVSLPVTLKTRLGWDENSIVIVEAAKMLEDIGIKALTVHCRLRSQGNKGDAQWDWVRRIKEADVKIPVILNGNVRTPEDVKLAFETYEPDAVMIGQGAIHNPWIFKQAKELMETSPLHPSPKERGNGFPYYEPTIEEKIDMCIMHLKLCCEFKGEERGTMEFRKFYSGYLRNLPNVGKVRMELMGMKSVDSIIERLERFKEEVQLIVDS